MDLWNEDEMYELAKRVHAHQRPSPPALKVLCMDFTINRWKSYVDFNKKLKLQPFDKIGEPRFVNYVSHIL